MDTKKLVPVALVGVALLTLVVYAVFFNSSAPQTAEQTAGVQSGAGNPATQTGSGQGSAQPAPQAPLPNEPVSSKEPATIVPDGTDLTQYCEKYYKAWKASDWETAFEMQPLAKKEGGDVKSFSQSLQGYGMVNYTLGEPEIDKNIAMLDVNLDLGTNGIWKTRWIFVKNDKDQWTVQSSKSAPIQ